MKRLAAPRRIAISAAAAMTLAAVLVPQTAFAFSARFAWSGVPACAAVSPSFSVSGAPKGATALRFVMHDEQAPAFRHGGSTVPLPVNGDVPRGAIHYVGPCPPDTERHTYVWTIEALGRDGRSLGSTRASGVFPPK